MSLDISLTRVQKTEVHSQNITHNLGAMAREAGIYLCLWRPDENNFKKAGDLIPLLEKAIADMEKRPKYYKKFDADNGWGTYEDFLPWLKELLEACREYPDAEIEVSR